MTLTSRDAVAPLCTAKVLGVILVTTSQILNHVVHASANTGAFVQGYILETKKGAIGCTHIVKSMQNEIMENGV